MFKVGDAVSGMYDREGVGTVLNSTGKVVGVAAHTGGGFKVTVRFFGGRLIDYIVSSTGASDYLMRNSHGGDSSDVGGAESTTP